MANLVLTGIRFCSIFVPMEMDGESERSVEISGGHVHPSFGILLLLATFFLFTENVIAESWNGIDPLKSTRVDVEKILGPCPNVEKASTCRYSLEDKTVLVIYASGTACSDTNRVWNIPDGTVTSISLNLANSGSLLRNSGFDLAQFEKEYDAELVGIVHYTKLGKGLRLETRGGFILSMYFGPSAKDSKRFAFPSIVLSIYNFERDGHYSGRLV